jgi:hypothetical protein
MYELATFLKVAVISTFAMFAVSVLANASSTLLLVKGITTV